MPMYNYRCPKGHQFEALETMANRHKSECFTCGAIADMVISAPRLDPNCDLPGLRMAQRRKMQERGRGKDMWSGNRTSEDIAVQRDAHAQRALRGENPIYSK
jgi:putative FmdB family regulatory protein